MTTAFTTSAWSCTMRLVVDDSRVLTPAAEDLVALLDRVDHAVSRFRDDSDLSIANARAGRPTPVSRLTAALVTAALDAARDTGGAVDPTVGAAVRDLGYDSDIAAIATDGPAVRPRRPAADWTAVRLDRSVGLLTVPTGTALDLGATAKAYTADLAARTLSRRYATAVLVELGGDVAMAGARRDGWQLDVAEREGGARQQVVVHGGGMCTSTTTLRAWRRGGKQLHHIVDPRTGAPADGPWRTVTVHAPSALAANTASTAAIVLGAGAPTWLTARGLAARLIGRNGAVQTTCGWPAPVLLEPLGIERLD
jgi:thiamine biosynthesis lipoprotein